MGSIPTLSIQSLFFAGVAQLVGLQFSKLNVVGSTPTPRFTHPHIHSILERWPSGLRPFFAKEVHLKMVPWVRIPSFPLFFCSWKSGRVVYGSSLENWCTYGYREFESPLFL